MNGRRDDLPPLLFLHFREQDVPVLDLVLQQPIVEDDAVAEELRPAELGEVGIHLVVAEVLAHIPGETATGIVAQRTVELVVWATLPDMSHLTVAVNVSARQFRLVDFVDQVLAIVDSTGADPGKLKLELTESLLLEDVEDIIVKMNALKAKGIGFSLDDFGTGFFSLSYLKRLPLDQLKIDQSFVRDVLTDPNAAAIAQTIVALAQSMDLAAIAEGVETEAQHEFLAANGCTAYQGYLFGRPMPIEVFSQRSRAPARKE